jgi:hypothetical protein
MAKRQLISITVSQELGGVAVFYTFAAVDESGWYAHDSYMSKLRINPPMPVLKRISSLCNRWAQAGKGEIVATGSGWMWQELAPANQEFRAREAAHEQAQ